MKSPTPAFMRRALEAVERGYRIGWAVFRTAEDLGIPRLEAIDQICNRPKTPRATSIEQRLELKTYGPRWLAKYFRPVSDAYLDGKPIEEVIKVWINTDRNDSDNELKRFAKTIMKEEDRTRYVAARPLNSRKGKNMWGAV